MDDFAMLYEAIVRRANRNCSRYGVAGADADIYRRMQSEFALDINGDQRNNPFERGESLGMVKAFLHDAIERLQTLYPQHEDALRGVEGQLIFASSCDEIDTILSNVQDILGPV